MAEPFATIFHISDIHIGEAGVTIEDFRKAITTIEEKAATSPSPLLLVTGDLTTEGLREEYEGAASVLNEVSIPKIIIPGNHDERNYGSAIFEEHFGDRFKTYESDNLVIFAADSAEPDNDAGHVGRVKYNDLRDFFNQAKNKIKIFALHHHLVAVPHTGREHNVVEDAGDVLGVLDNSRCSLVLNGHRHVPWMWRLGEIVLYNTGTLLSRRVRGAMTQLHTRISLTTTQASFTLCHKDGTEKLFAQAPLRI
ncbi:MAG: metallophosphoesterase family protein [Candidatus Thorarchaeota archaeon]